MAKPTHVFVTAAPDREVPVPTGEGSAPGGVLLRCLPGKIYRLPLTTYTRRRIAGGDLVLTNLGGTKVADVEKAAAPTDADAVATDDTGAVIGLAPAPAPAQAPAPVPAPPTPPTLPDVPAASESAPTPRKG